MQRWRQIYVTDGNGNVASVTMNNSGQVMRGQTRLNQFGFVQPPQLPPSQTRLEQWGFVPPPPLIPPRPAQPVTGPADYVLQRRLPLRYRQRYDDDFRSDSGDEDYIQPLDSDSDSDDDIPPDPPRRRRRAQPQRRRVQFALPPPPPPPVVIPPPRRDWKPNIKPDVKPKYFKRE